MRETLSGGQLFVFVAFAREDLRSESQKKSVSRVGKLENIDAKFVLFF